MMLLRTVVGSALMISLMTGCQADAGNNGGQEAEFDATFETLIGYPWQDVGTVGLSDGAIAILAEARANGLVTLSDLEQATQLTFECFDSVGIPWSRNGGTEYLGLPTVEYTFRAPVGTEEGDMSWFPLAQACQDANSLVVQTLYENQPHSVDRQQQWFEERRQADAVACLEDAGVTIDEGADFLWFVTAGWDLYNETGDSTCLELIVG